MHLTTIQGIVKNGQIQLSEDVTLPELSKVFVVIPPDENVKRVMSPRLVNKADAKFFVKTVEDDIDGEI